MKKRFAIFILPFLLLMMTQLSSDQRDALGDVNNDGIINVQDIIRVVNIILENDPAPSDYELWAGDVNSDESIDVTDIIILVNFILGTGILCEEGYSFCPGSITECCADITSHDFTWEVDTIGNYGSWINDVYVFDEENIWIVGNIEADGQEFNAAHWNGLEWEYIEIINTADLYSVWYFDEEDIWVTTFGFPVHWDGEEWTLYHLQDLGLQVSAGHACWGTSSNNMYFVGYQGAIVHYDGENFEQMESGTTTDLLDVHGTQDGSILFAAGYEITGESVALMYDGQSWSELYEGESYFVGPGSTYGRISSVEAMGDTAYFATTAGLLKYVISTGEYLLTAQDQAPFYDYHFDDISMNTVNDMMLISRVNSFLHFNGETWFHDTSVSQVQDTWAKAGKLKGNICVSVGFCCNQQHAFVARGIRN